MEKKLYKKRLLGELSDVINDYYKDAGIKTERQIYEDRCKRLEKARAVRALKMKARREAKDRDTYFHEEEKKKQTSFLEGFSLLTIRDVSTLLQISHTSVVKILKSGQLPSIDIGTSTKSNYRVNRKDLYQFLKECYIQDIDGTYTEEELETLKTRKEAFSPKASVDLIQPDRESSS